MNRSEDHLPDTARVPDDVVDLLIPGDHAPGGPVRIGQQCSVGWHDVQDLIGGGPPWQCARPEGHDGQHIAFAPGAHVAAVLPALE